MAGGSITFILLLSLALCTPRDFISRQALISVSKEVHAALPAQPFLLQEAGCVGTAGARVGSADPRLLPVQTGLLQAHACGSSGAAVTNDLGLSP